MTLLSSLHPESNVGVIGASGGIGRAFVELLAGDAGVRQVHAFCRTPGEWRESKVVTHRLDVLDEGSIEAAAAAATSAAPLDLVIVATGILHRGERIKPEKAMCEIDSNSLAEVLAVSRPFTKRVPESKLFTPAMSATKLLGVLDALSSDQTGGFFAYDGSQIDY